MAGKAKRKNKVRVRVSSQDLPELQQARAMWIAKRYRQSLDMFDRAVRKHPGNTLALTDAARAFGARFEFDRAERLVERLIEIGGHRAELLQQAGQSYRMIQRPKKSIECLEMALQMSPDLFEARLELALLYERRHELEPGLTHIVECLDRRPHSAEAKFLHGRLLRRMGNVSEAEPLLRAVAQQERNHAIVRAQAWHDLGQLLDEAGQYDEAFEAVTAGKAVQRADASGTKRQSKQESDRLENLHSELTEEHFLRWQAEADQLGTERVALLTGPPRSGTTLLERVLDSHPDVVSSDEQVALPTYILPSLFLHKAADELLSAVDLDKIELAQLVQERERYLRYVSGAMGEAIGARMHIDKNPSIVMLIPGMLRLFPECRLLMAIRDPRDVAVSCFMRYLPLNTVSVQFFSMEGAAERNRRDMEAWFRLREMIPASWLEVRYEDAVQDLEREARRALEFLGVAWDDSVMSYRERLQDRPVNSPTYEDVAKPIYRSSIERWKNYEKHLGPAMNVLEPIIQRLNY